MRYATANAPYPYFGHSYYIISGGRGNNGSFSPDNSPGVNIHIPSRAWKVVLGFNSGSTSQYPDFAYAVDIPNDARSAGTSWRQYQLSIKQLQQRLNPELISSGFQYDFLAEVTDPSRKDFLENAGSNLNASLLALPDSTGIGEDNLSFVAPNTAVWHDSIPEDSILDVGYFPHGIIFQQSNIQGRPQEVRLSQIGSTEINVNKVSLGEIGLSQVGVPKINLDKLSLLKVSSTEICSPKTNTLSQIGTTKVNPLQVCIPETYLEEPSFAQVSPAQISPLERFFEQGNTAQVSPAQIDSFKGNTVKISSFEIDPTQIDTSQISGKLVIEINASKISLSGGIASEQLLNAYPHSSVTSSFYNINSTALNLWKTFSQTGTPFNIEFLVKDLPAGQLAEAQITKFDPQGRPNGGTIILDHNANQRHRMVHRPHPL